MLGTVLTRTWLKERDGAITDRIYGEVKSHPSEQMLGFKTNSRDSNWCVSVTRDDGTRVWIMGCEVLAIIEDAP